MSWAQNPQALLQRVHDGIEHPILLFWRIAGKVSVQRRTVGVTTPQVMMVKLAGSRFAVMHRVLGNYRIHAQAISGSGALNRQYLEDLERIRNRLAEANIAVSPVRSAAFRVMHKTNFIRHFRSLVVR